METRTTKAKEARKTSEAKYKAIFDSVNDAILIHDPGTGAILEINRKMTEMFGYTADEARAITVGDISSGIPPYTQQEAEGKMKSALERGEILFEWNSKDKAGNLFWVEVNLTPMEFNDNLRIIATVRDITQRKSAEEALAHSREQAELERKHLEAILEANPSAVVLIDASTGRLSYMNRRAMDLYGFDYAGFDMDDHLAKVHALRADGTPYPVAEMPFSHSLKGEDVHNEEVIIERADGAHLPVLVSSAPLFDAGGGVATVVVVFDDITHRKKVEESLRESEEKYRSLFESSIDGILISDLDGGIYSANPAACRIMGRTEEEIVRAGRDELAVTDDPRFNACLEERARTGSTRCELIQKRKDGTTYPVEISTSLMKDRQGRTKASVIFRDISERKGNEEKIRRLNEDLEGKVHDRTVALSKAVARLEGQRELLQTIIDHIPHDRHPLQSKERAAAGEQGVREAHRVVPG